MIRLICCIIYYCFFQYLPSSYQRGFRIFASLRLWICRPMFGSCGQNVLIEPRAFFHSGRTIKIGDRSSIGERCRLNGDITIGKDVMMGEDVLMITQNHESSRIDIAMNQQGFKNNQPIVISDDVWIGSRVIILPGVNVGRGSIIGAGSVVARDVEEYAVVIGNPAKVVKFRGR